MKWPSELKQRSELLEPQCIFILALAVFLSGRGRKGRKRRNQVSHIKREIDANGHASAAS